MSHAKTAGPSQDTFHAVLPIPFKPPKVSGLSIVLESYYVEHYGSAVRHLNQCEADMAQFDGKPSDAHTRNEFSQNLLHAKTNVQLQETFLHSIAESGAETTGIEAVSDVLTQLMIRDFASVEQWQQEFCLLAQKHLGTSGWLVLLWSKPLNRLMNLIVLGDSAMLGDAEPLVALDLHEHAYLPELQEAPDQYIESFIKALHWQNIGTRLDNAGGSLQESPSKCGSHKASAPEYDDYAVAVAELKAQVDNAETKPLVLDVRHTDDRERQAACILDTPWRDSFNVEKWAGDLPKDTPVVVYCAYGGWVSQDAAAELRQLGYDASYLEGGVTSWCAMGFPNDRFDDR